MSAEANLLRKSTTLPEPAAPLRNGRSSVRSCLKLNPERAKFLGRIGAYAKLAKYAARGATDAVLCAPEETALDQLLMQSPGCVGPLTRATE